MMKLTFSSFRLWTVRLLVGTCMLLAVAGCSLPLEAETATGLVSRVVDGDTLKVIMDGEEETVRLLLVDTPETKHPNKAVEPFGPEASEFAKDMLEGQTVRLEFDGPKRDKYDRLLAYVWIDDALFNELLVEKGLARVAYVYDPPYTHYDAIARAEDQARERKIGIWSIAGYVKEDGFDSALAAAYWEEQEAETESTLDAGDRAHTEVAAAGDAAAGEAEPPACDNPQIKGNINSKGEKIYHLPGGQYYERTKAEMMFCNVEEAVAAGFRAAMR